MARIVLDQTGDLKEGYFYELGIPLSGDQDDVSDLRSPPGQDENDIVALAPSSVEQSKAWQERVMGIERFRRCPLNGDHETEVYWTEYLVTSLWPSIEWSPLLCVRWDADGATMITRQVAASLRQTPFRGYRLTPARPGAEPGEWVVLADASGGDDAVLYDLQFRGRSCRRGKTILDAPNNCPFCGHEPLFCPSCEFSPRDCPRCNKECFAVPRNHKGESDQRYLLTEVPDRRSRRILEASRWDGSDFIWGTEHPGLAGHFVTKRVVDWLLSIHATPFVAKPVLVDVEGASAEVLERLEEIKRLQPAP